ncbi:hypothetical protein GW17_00010114 [Ensete ventricosum]|nr:hypothetical protein GW17_00010114 [Ensete ventricosum]
MKGSSSISTPGCQARSQANASWYPYSMETAPFGQGLSQTQETFCPGILKLSLGIIKLPVGLSQFPPQVVQPEGSRLKFEPWMPDLRPQPLL